MRKMQGTEVDVRLVPLATPSSSDTATTLPVALADVPAGNSFYLEVWTKDTGTPAQGISGGFLDIQYNPALLNATGLSNGSTYTLFPSGTIDNLSGMVDDFGGDWSVSGPTPGLTSWARLGYIDFTRTVAGAVTFTPSASTLDEFSRFSGGSASWSQVNAPAATMGTPEPSSLALLAGAMAAVSLAAWRRRRAK